MASTTTLHTISGTPIREVTLNHPWRWLALGWQDMLHQPLVSLTYGGIFTAIGYVLAIALYNFGLAYLIVPLVMGFALVGPALAVGLYHVSQRIEMGRQTTLLQAFLAWRHNGAQIALMGFALFLCFMAWIRFSTMIFMLFYGSAPPSLEGLVGHMMDSERFLPFFLLTFGSGAVLAFAVFAVSAVSVPMLLDRKVDVVTAMLSSVDAVRLNFKPMLLWACLIAFFTILGLGLFFIGLAVTLPLIGHASWHVYRDVMEK